MAEEVSVPKKYADFSDVFSKELVVMLSERSDINEHAINLEPDKQSSYRPIYSLGLVKLKTLKTYIETNPANEFIQPSKFPAKAPIFFVKKPYKSLCLYIDYYGLNNLRLPG